VSNRTVIQKIGDWKQAYDMIRPELTPDQMRTILAEMQGVDGIQQFKSYVDLAKAVMSNDRAAGTIAALITQTGIKPTEIDYEDE